MGVDILRVPKFRREFALTKSVALEWRHANSTRVQEEEGGTLVDFREEYPFESRWMQIDGHRFHYVDEGSGPTLLMVHGNPTWSFLWRRLISRLRDRYRVVAMDHIGCGLSDKPEGYPYVLAQHVKNLREFVRRLELPEFVLFGHDWGGCIGVGMAEEERQRLRGMVLANTAAFRSKRIPWRIAACRVPVIGTVAVRGLNLFSWAALWMAVERRSSLTEAAKAGLLYPYDSWRNRVGVMEFVKDIPLREGDRSYASLKRIEEGLASLRNCPTLLVWGMRDWCFSPEFLSEFQRFLPEAEVLRIADAGHYVFEEGLDLIMPGVEGFLQKVTGSGSRRQGSERTR